MLSLTGKTRVAANTLISYGRSLIAICLVLFSSRWALGSLGEVDFGLYNLVGSVLAVVVFINTILANGDARFFAIGIGKDDQTELNKVFNTSLSLHLLIPVFVIIVGSIIGEFVIEHYLVIPPERIDSVIYVFRITMFASFVSMVSIPFSTLFIAHQNIFEYSIIMLLQTFLIFLSAFLIRYSFGGTDKLLLYAIFMALAHIMSSLAMIVVSRRKYKCSRIQFKYFFDKGISESIIKYSFWNMLGDLGHLVRTQGIAVVVNLFFGPSGNAALGIANQVSMQASNLTNAMTTSLSPEIYRLTGENNINAAIKLSGYASRVGVFLLLVLGVPIILNLDSLLNLWLIEIPEGTNTLCICFVIMYIIEKLSLGQLIYLRAIGNVAIVNVLVFLFYCTSVLFPFCGFLQLGLLGIGLSCILSMFFSRCSILYCFNLQIQGFVKSYALNTFLPTLLIVFFISIIAYCSVQLYTESLFGLFANGMLVLVPTLVISSLLLFNKGERKRVYSVVMTKIKER